MTRESPEDRRVTILRTTVNVIIERGFAALRIGDVARQLGISTGLVHYHFDSKEQLIAEALRFAADDERASMDDEVSAAEGAVEKLDTVFRAYCPKEAEPSWLLWIDSWGESMRSPELRTISQELDVAFAELPTDSIEQRVAEGTFSTRDSRAAAWRLSSLIDGLAVQLTVHDGIVEGITMLDWVRQGAGNELGCDVKLFTRRRKRRAA
jgi:AcrR family transcriptional regulator